jgi:AcrR family transcriptional regulator
MRAAGLTHGGFYAHFASREAMLAEAADHAGAEAVAAMTRIAAAAPPQQALQALLRAYLSKAHVEAVETAAQSPRSARRCRARRPSCGAPPRAGSRRWSTWSPANRPIGDSRARTSVL